MREEKNKAGSAERPRCCPADLRHRREPNLRLPAQGTFIGMRAAPRCPLHKGSPAASQGTGPGSIHGSIQWSGAPAGRRGGENNARFLYVRNKGMETGRFGAMGSAAGTLLPLGQRRGPRSRYPGAGREKAAIKPLMRDFAGMDGGNSKGGLQRAFMAPCPLNPRGGVSCASPIALTEPEHPLPDTNHLRCLKPSSPWWKLHWERAASPAWRH